MKDMKSVTETAVTWSHLRQIRLLYETKEILCGA